MKKMIAMLSMGILIAGSSFAQTTLPQEGRKPRFEQRGERSQGQKEKKTPEQFAADRTARLDKQLNLTEAQEKRINNLFLQQSREREQLRANRQPGEKRDGQNKGFKKEAHAKWEAELKQILTKEQYAKLEVNRQEKRTRFERKVQKRGVEQRGKELRQNQQNG
ncbi:hypothetical protein [Sabulibacter ruber]|uniref:hypothetical protein n=1 Tax=Sabulibacter ruber TaxID=2811901 RepID=UPI001A963E67|nr:hypothetical protein [Sabulibacter ruber]